MSADSVPSGNQPDLMGIRERALARERPRQRASLEGKLVTPKSWTGGSWLSQPPKPVAYGLLEDVSVAAEDRRKAAITCAAASLRSAGEDSAPAQLKLILDMLGLTDVELSEAFFF